MNPLTAAYVLIGIGLALLIAEAFVPASGFLIISCVVCLLTGIALAFTFGSLTTGLITLLGIFVALPLALTLLLYFWPRTFVGKRLIRKPADSDATIASMPVLLELEHLRGRYGRSASDLRPAGVAIFEGKRIDVMSEAGLIPADTSIRCIDVRASRVIVRAVEPPSLEAMDMADFQ